MKHQHARKGKVSSTYQSWRNMIQRCFNKNRPDFLRYGGRGITVCEEWRKFDAFLRDMGERPLNTSLDRVDCNGPYCKSNCRWESNKTQAQNRSSSKLTENVRKKIKRLRKSGLPNTKIASLIGVNRTAVDRFVNGKTWQS